MKLYANYPVKSTQDIGEWAKQMEELGYDGICASDHFWIDVGFPHVFVAATQMLLSTNHVKVTTSFANNLLRSPMEFAQASLSLAKLSNGRFEPGLGAGWFKEEILKSGLSFPVGKDRLRRYLEALQITKEILATGCVSYEGEHYTIDNSEVPLPLPDYQPTLTGSAGFTGSIRAVAPVVDRIEIPSAARATINNDLNFEIVRTITADQLQDDIGVAKEASPDVPVGLFLYFVVGNEEETAPWCELFGDGFLGQFIGSKEKVLSAIDDLRSWNLSHLQLTGLTVESVDRLLVA